MADNYYGGCTKQKEKMRCGHGLVSVLIASSVIVTVGILVHKCSKDYDDGKAKEVLHQLLVDDGQLSSDDISKVQEVSDSKNVRWAIADTLTDIGDKAFREGNYNVAGENYSKSTGYSDNFYSLYSLALSNLVGGVGYKYVTYTSGIKKWWFGEKRITDTWWLPEHKKLALEQLNRSYWLTDNKFWKEKIQDCVNGLNSKPGDTGTKYFRDGSYQEFPLIRD